MEAIVIYLAGEPQGKGRARSRIVRGNKSDFIQTYTPTKTRTYESRLSHVAQIAMGNLKPLDGALFLTATATHSVPASWSKKKRKAALDGEIWPTVKPDFDNIAKTVDALNGIVFVDDKQIVAGTIVKIYGEKPGMRFVIRMASRPSP